MGNMRTIIGIVVTLSAAAIVAAIGSGLMLLLVRLVIDHL